MNCSEATTPHGGEMMARITLLTLALAAACGAPADTREAPGLAAGEATTPAAPTTNRDSPTSDRAALVALYHATDGANWTNNRGWLSDAPLGTWHGVTTDPTGRVILLILNGNQLSGSIPPELGRLEKLMTLVLLDNQLRGAIPAELGELANLDFLDLSWNQLTGTIPPEISRLSGLGILDLRDNQLHGSIPPALSNLSSLEWLHLGGNQLTGTIPPELGRLSRLRILDLRDNWLSGSIPLALTNLSSLERLYIGLNPQLTGCIPNALQELEVSDVEGLGLPVC